MYKSKVKNTHNLSKYKLYTKDLNPNNPYHARILENFRNIKRQEDEKLRKTRDSEQGLQLQQVIL
tara:strand:+ start:5918 stop:6112 length:195 start_codon:yes stop_codon:yes gene_type:complete